MELGYHVGHVVPASQDNKYPPPPKTANIDRILSITVFSCDTINYAI